MHSIVYHQFRRNCISSSTELLHLIIAEVYIQPAADYIRLTAIIFTLLRDDIPLLSQWIKKDPTNRLSLFYGPSDRNKYNRKCLPRILRCAHVTSSSARRLKNAPQEPFYLRKFRSKFFSAQPVRLLPHKLNYRNKGHLLRDVPYSYGPSDRSRTCGLLNPILYM